jgi:hypothetical protein
MRCAPHYCVSGSWPREARKRALILVALGIEGAFRCGLRRRRFRLLRALCWRVLQSYIARNVECVGPLVRVNGGARCGTRGGLGFLGGFDVIGRQSELSP